MASLMIPSEVRTPELNFDWETGVFSIRGESYPEDVQKFYAGPIKYFSDWLREQPGMPLLFEFNLTYFNSSSAKIIMDLFSLIEEAANGGRPASVMWYYAFDDDNAKELGEELGSELKTAMFQLCEFTN